ncbi:MAG: phosphoserine phosphatase SerB [Parvularculaceae bacterium]
MNDAIDDERFVCSLICGPARPALDEALLARVGAALSALGVADGEDWRMLAPGVACELGVSRRDGVAEAALEALQGAPVDVNIVPAANREKRFLIADMDSTIIEQECLDELADFAGLKDEIAAVTERAMRGELDFEKALLERVARLEGLDASALERTWTERISLTPGATTLVATMRERRGFAALVSGGFTFFTDKVARAAGFDVHRANELEIAENALTGDVRKPILGRDAKAAALNELTRGRGLSPADALAVGDGANDLAMIGAAGLGVAFRAKPAVAAAADARGYHGDLTALLFLQGLSADDFVGA